jgi:hypothetical protein
MKNTFNIEASAPASVRPSSVQKTEERGRVVLEFYVSRESDLFLKAVLKYMNDNFGPDTKVQTAIKWMMTIGYKECAKHIGYTLPDDFHW